MVKIVIIILFLIVSSHANANEYGRSAYIEQAIKDSIQEMKNKLPLAIDALHIATEVILKDGVVTLSYEMRGIDFENLDFDKYRKHRLLSTIITACTNDELRFYFDNGYSLRYIYFSPTEKLFNILIQPRDCKPIINNDIQQLVNRYIKLNKEILPMKLDSETEFINIRKRKNSIEFEFQTVNYKKDEIDLNTLEDYVKANMPIKRCTSPDSKLFLENGFNIIDTYIDNRGLSVLSYETSIGDCMDLLRSKVYDDL